MNESNQHSGTPSAEASKTKDLNRTAATSNQTIAAFQPSSENEIPTTSTPAHWTTVLTDRSIHPPLAGPQAPPLQPQTGRTPRQGMQMTLTLQQSVPSQQRRSLMDAAQQALDELARREEAGEARKDQEWKE